MLKKSWIFIVLLLCWSASAYADQDVAGFSGQIYKGFMALIQLSYIMCWVGGAGMIFGALIQYKAHRDNPQQVRLSRPFVFLAFGIVFICIPFLVKWVVSTGGVTPYYQ